MISHTQNNATSPKSLHRLSKACLWLEVPGLLPSLLSPLRANSKQSQQGSALIVLIAVILIGAALSAGIVSMTTTSSFTGLSYNPSDQARYLAQSGLEYARTLIQSDPDKAQELENWVVYTVDDGQFELKYDDETKLITSIGRVFVGTSREANFKLAGLIQRTGGLLAEYLFEIEDDLGRDTGIYNYHGTPEPGVAQRPKLCSSNVLAYTDPLNPDASTCYFARFDGEDSGIAIRPDGEEAELEFEDEITVMAWVRWGVEPASADPFATILASSRHGTLGQFWLQHGGSNNAFYEFAVQTETGREWVRSSSQSSQEWRHVTGVYDGSSVMIYIDGIKQSQVKSLSGNILPQRDTDKFVFKIGSDRFSGRKFTGDIDEVRVFDAALSEADINAYRTKTRECKIPRLMAEYRFDECSWDGSAGEVIDSSGNDLHGTIFGNPELAPGKINNFNAGSFKNGESMGISLPVSPALRPQEEITISAWIKWDGVSNLGLQNIYHFGNWQQFLRLDQTGDIVFGLTNKGTLRASNVVNNLWNHVAATYNGHRMIIYINGQEQESQNASGDIAYTGNQFIIGNISTGQTSSFNGKIDELKIFDRALTSQQISTLYNNENAGNNCDGSTREPIICPGDDDNDENDNNKGKPSDYVIFTGGDISIPSGGLVDGSIYGRSVTIRSSGAHITGDVISESYVIIESGNTVSGNICAPEYVELRSSNSHVLGDIIAGGNVQVRSGCSVHGNVISGGNVSLYNSNSVVQNNVHAGNNLSMGNNTRVEGSVWTGGSISIGTPGSIDGNIGGTAYQNQPSPPRILPMECPDVPKPQMQSFTAGDEPTPSTNPVLPGSYQALVQASNGTRTLVAGNCQNVGDPGCYYFSSISGGGNQARLRLDLSTSGDIVVFVTGDIRYSGPVEISTDGITWTDVRNLDLDTAKELAKRVYWETHGDFEITSSAGSYGRQWFGTTLAKNTISLESGMRMIGSMATVNGNVTSGSNIHITFVPADFAKEHW